MRLRIASIVFLLLCLATLPAAAQVIYDNGPINGTTDAWQINFGFVVSDSFTVGGAGASVTGMNFGAWVFPGDVLQAAEISITSSEFGGTTYFDGFINFTQTNCVTNQYGFNICTEVSDPFGPVNLAPGTYWVSLQNVPDVGDPYYWDENSGPSQASSNSVGTIPSESFTLYGGSGAGPGPGSTPEPSSIMLFGSGILGLAGMLHRKWR